jgi:hypothetical protein
LEAPIISTLACILSYILWANQMPTVIGRSCVALAP